jgi:hypothetical protein
MLPEMEAIRSSCGDGLLHCRHCIGLSHILENIIPDRDREYANSDGHHAPEAVDSCLLVRLEPLVRTNSPIADLHLQNDETS